MTRLFNDPTAFADELIAGFVAANRGHVRPVPGGVVRATRSEPGAVALIVGGGSGHYPAFGGLVGPGLAHGAAMGNVFASPSTQQVLSVARAAHNGGGVLLCYGNYAGDVLNFDAAEAQLRAEGIEARTVTVTDDISSAPVSEKQRRRGVAGDLAVFKIAGAAAEAGYPLDEVARVASLANDRTRSFGVAFTGCTLPGAVTPLFTVPEGRMALGLGIHGEPGIGEADIPTADGLALIFVEALLAELPDDIPSPDGQRVAVILNGLGSVKHEELYVVYGGIARRLEETGIEIVEPEVGEFCTSFDMAGVSLTLLWLDQELEPLWRAGAESAGYRKGVIEARELADIAEPAPMAPEAVIAPASIDARRAAVRVVAVVDAISRVIDENVDELGLIDAVAGDGDHGIGMQRGASAASTAAHAAAAASAGAGTTLIRAADAWSDRAGGTSGALWGIALRALGTRIGDETKPDAATIASGVQEALDGIRTYGKAVVGDKTMVDAIVPFAETLAARVASGDGFATSWTLAAAAATDAAAATADLLPRMGRARPHAERSLGTPDAGAHSFALIVTAIAATLSRKDTVS